MPPQKGFLTGVRGREDKRFWSASVSEGEQSGLRKSLFGVAK